MENDVISWKPLHLGEVRNSQNARKILAQKAILIGDCLNRDFDNFLHTDKQEDCILEDVYPRDLGFAEKAPLKTIVLEALASGFKPCPMEAIILAAVNQPGLWDDNPWIPFVVVQVVNGQPQYSTVSLVGRDSWHSIGRAYRDHDVKYQPEERLVFVA